MAAAASASSSGPRYAPDDPTLPKPWKGLVDGNTGYLYFWNPDTNVTQYDRPVATSLPGPPRLPPPPPKSTSVPISSSVHVREPSGSSALVHQQHHSKEVDSRHGSSNNGPRLAPIPGARNHQVQLPPSCPLLLSFMCASLYLGGLRRFLAVIIAMKCEFLVRQLDNITYYLTRIIVFTGSVIVTMSSENAMSC